MAFKATRLPLKFMNKNQVLFEQQDRSVYTSIIAYLNNRTEDFKYASYLI